MIVHMLRDNATGLYYRRSNGCGPGWVRQDRAAIWPTQGGAGGALGYCREHARRSKKPDTFEIVDFAMTEIKNDIKSDHPAVLARSQADSSQEGH